MEILQAGMIVSGQVSLSLINIISLQDRIPE
jgi:hypothetical protein